MVAPSFRITLLGAPRVKKNTQKVVWRKGRSIKVNSKAYNAWHKLALEQLSEDGYYPKFKEAQDLDPSLKPLIDYRSNMECKFYMKTAGKVDLSALYEGVQDLFAEVGIISDDNYTIIASHDGSGVWIDPKNPRMIITITAKETSHEEPIS